jgi:hypothetical protein
MNRDAGPLVVVQPGAPQLAVVQVKAERFDQVQATAGVRAQPDYVAGIGRNLWLKKHNM